MDFSVISERIRDFVGTEVGVAIVTIFGYMLLRVVWRKILFIACFFNSRRRALRAVARERTKDGPREGQGLWLQKPTYPPENYLESSGPPTLILANNKGGVAKTTLAANLGAYWAREWRKNVLLIDLDYQGTLSTMALRSSSNWIVKGQDSAATRAMSGDLEPSILVKCAQTVPQEPKLKIIPAFYDVAQADNRLIVEWLLQCTPQRRRSLRARMADLLIGQLFRLQDVRYNLATVLQTKAVRDAFDAIIIDCPPRLSTGVIQALCAGSHILIPTILDRPSAEAVVSFCNELETLRANDICPNLQYVGVVGTRVSANVDQIAENDAKQMVSTALSDTNFPTGLLHDDHFMRQSVAFLNDAEEGIAYLVMGNAQRQQDIRHAMGDLADYVAAQIGLAPPQAHERREAA